MMDAPTAADPVAEFMARLGPMELAGHWGQDSRAYIVRARALLFEDYLAGASGSVIVQRFTATVDRVVQSLFAAARLRFASRYAILDQRLTLVAQGGYGRAELNPYSDIDLLFLYPYRRDPYGETITESVVYALYDTGLRVGQAFRNSKECVSLAARDFKVKTSLLDLRYVAGDEPLYREFTGAMEKDVLKRNADGYFKEKLAENQQRHARYGDSIYILEPHLKEGEGGLRDLHTAMWLAKVKFNTNSVAELVRKSVITEREEEEVEAARDFLWRVRNGLHFRSDQYQDHLTFEYQEKIAADLGYRDDGKFRGVEQFMRAYYLNAVTVNRFSEEVIARCMERRLAYRLGVRFGGRAIRRGIRIAGGELVVGDPAPFVSDPGNLIRVFGDAQQHHVPLSADTRRLIRSHLHLLDDATRHSDAVGTAFFEILRLKQGVYDALYDMHKMGVLGAVLPEFGNLLCMAQYDLYHIYTVDEHSLRGVRVLEQLRLGEFKEKEPLLTEVMRELDKVEILYLGMLLHDIGKGQGGDHSNRGAAMVAGLAERLQLNADDARELEYLIRQHLAMHHLATRRDIHDEQLVIDFAKTAGTVEAVKKLYLMTFADMKAVNPKVWNNWHGMLLGELYVGAAGVFERGDFVPGDQAERVARIRARVAEESGAELGAAFVSFLADMPDRYFLTTPESDIAAHFDMIRRYGEESLVMEVQHFAEREFSEFTVVAPDRPGLFSKITGVLTANGVNILTGRITTSGSGIALDVFRLSHLDPDAGARNEDRWERIQITLARVLAGELDVEQLVAAAYRPGILDRKFVPRVATEVEIDNEVSEKFSVIDIYAQDRVGVLFAMTNALFHLNLSIYLAKITTNVDQVLDVFYVSDADGRKVTDAAELEHIRNTLLAALRTPVGTAPAVEAAPPVG